MAIETRSATAEDALALHAKTGARCEVVAGELKEMAPTGLEHGGIVSEAAFHLQRYVLEHPVGVVV
ncbi:MAG: Uma2 family endonuclease, partial [Chloroflexota bacterium]